MRELTDLMSKCLEKYNTCAPCDGNTCKLNFYCTANNCAHGRCDRCLNHIQRSPLPQFHYSCEKITYQYVLRFFNRFASEIAYLIGSIKKSYLQERKKLNVVSLGCGPGSEVYGFIKALRINAPHIVLDYQGFDMNAIWDTVQQLSKTALSQTPHHIEFHNLNMFGAFEGFQEGGVDMLVLNYLLSDAQKFYFNDEGRIKFIDEICQFIIANGVKSIIFNDNCFYGHSGLDSGVRMMLKLIQYLKKSQLQLKLFFRYFPADPYVPNSSWQGYKKGNLLFTPLVGNTHDVNVSSCKSKQIIVLIN